MAIHNEILSPRIPRLIQKILSIKGPQSTPQVSGELIPVMPIYMGSENRFHEAWSLFGQSFASAAAVAAQNTAVRLRNPAGSNIVAVITKVILATASVADNAVFIQQTTIATDLATILNPTLSAFDNRQPQKQPTLISSTATNVASTGGTKWQGSLSSPGQVDVINTEMQEWPMLPGDAMTVATTAVNISFVVSVFWRERFLEESERQ